MALGAPAETVGGRPENGPVEPRACVTCGGSMEGRAAQARSCSSACRERARTVANRGHANELRRQRKANEEPEQREHRLALKRRWERENITPQMRRERYMANREAWAARGKVYRAENAEQTRARHAAYYAANRQALAERGKAYRDRTRETRNAKGRERWARMVAAGEVKRSQWKQNNPEAARLSSRLYQARRRAWKRQSPVQPVSLREITRLVARYDGCCAYCQTAPATDLDHVIPLSRGGAHSIGNLLPACGRCNRSKGARTVTEWRATPTYLLRVS